MLTTTRRPIVALLLGLVLVPLLLVPAWTNANAASLSQLDATPGDRIYLPLVIKQPTQAGAPPPNPGMEQAVADQLNERRSAYGLAPVALVPELGQAARGHSQDMADHDFVDHTGSDGSSPGERMAEAGYDWTTWGEIIACGAIADAGEVVDLWMDSPGHRAIILSSSYADFGVGYVSDPGSEWGRYWTVDFAKPSSVSSP